jgi:hypothetical protein
MRLLLSVSSSTRACARPRRRCGRQVPARPSRPSRRGCRRARPTLISTVCRKGEPNRPSPAGDEGQFGVEPHIVEVAAAARFPVPAAAPPRARRASAAIRGATPGSAREAGRSSGNPRRSAPRPSPAPSPIPCCGTTRSTMAARTVPPWGCRSARPPQARSAPRPPPTSNAGRVGHRRRRNCRAMALRIGAMAPPEGRVSCRSRPRGAGGSRIPAPCRCPAPRN